MLLFTTDSKLATFVNENSRGVDPKLRLRVGGDVGSEIKHPLWTYPRTVSKS